MFIADKKARRDFYLKGLFFWADLYLVEVRQRTHTVTESADTETDGSVLLHAAVTAEEEEEEGCGAKVQHSPAFPASLADIHSR